MDFALEVDLAAVIKSFGVAGFSLPFHQRVAMLVEMVGGLGSAARIAKADPDTVNNWRKEGARVPLLGVLPLAVEAGVSLDWVAVGYQVRPDLERPEEPPIGFTRLEPLRPMRQPPPSSEIAISEAWLEAHGLTSDSARYVISEDDAMAPLIGKGAFLVVDNRPGKLRSGLYLVEVGEELLVRRLHPMPGGAADLVPELASHPRYNISGSDAGMLGLYRIVWGGLDF